MSDFELAVGITGIQQAVQGLGQLTAAVGQTEQQTRSAGTAAQAGAASTGALGQTALAATQHIAGAANALAGLANRLGSPGVARGASVIGSIASTTAQFASLGAVLGPQGALVGGIIGAAIPAFEALTRAQDGSRSAADRLQRSLTDVINEANSAYQAQARFSQLSQGRGTAVEQAAFAGQSSDRVQLITRALAGDAESIRALRRQGVTGSFDTAPSIGDRITAAVTGRDVIQLSDSERGLLEQLRQHAIQQFQQREQLVDTAIETAADAVATGGSGGARSRRGGGGGSRSSAPSLDDLMTRAAGGSGDLGSILSSATSDGKAAETEAYVRQREQEQAQLEKQRDLEARAADATRAHAQAQRELADAANDAQHAFADGYVTSIDQVIAAYTQANRSLRAANMEMLSSSRLLERGMVAVGNNIAEVVGGTMKGAFESALGAWLDGSKSFVQAAEEMAKGVLKALVTESIVQAVTETARGIADLASYHYDTAGLHFAAAAAWAAVGAVAGGVGAAVGAFGGGGGTSQGATATRDAGREQSRDQGGGGNATFNVYPGGFITKKDMQAALVDAINQAGRSGYQVSRQAIQGA